MVSVLQDREIGYAAVMQREDWVPCSSAGNCTPTSRMLQKLQDNTLFGSSRQMNSETALGTFKARSGSPAKFWEYWRTSWSLFDSVKAVRKIRKLYNTLYIGSI